MKRVSIEVARHDNSLAAPGVGPDHCVLDASDGMYYFLYGSCLAIANFEN